MELLHIGDKAGFDVLIQKSEKPVMGLLGYLVRSLPDAGSCNRRIGQRLS